MAPVRRCQEPLPYKLSSAPKEERGGGVVSGVSSTRRCRKWRHWSLRQGVTQLCRPMTPDENTSNDGFTGTDLLIKIDPPEAAPDFGLRGISHL